jgi:hypothetical protein
MWGRVLKAAAAYFALVFAAGFVLGTLRTLWLAPALGPVSAVVAELPVMLVWSWLACGFVLRRTPLPRPEAAVMGGLAFVLLLAAEAVLSTTLGGLTLLQHLALYAEPANQLGLAGQIAFAAFPVLRSVSPQAA